MLRSENYAVSVDRLVTTKAVNALTGICVGGAGFARALRETSRNVIKFPAVANESACFAHYNFIGKFREAERGRQATFFNELNFSIVVGGVCRVELNLSSELQPYSHRRSLQQVSAAKYANYFSIGITGAVTPALLIFYPRRAWKSGFKCYCQSEPLLCDSEEYQTSGILFRKN